MTRFWFASALLVSQLIGCGSDEVDNAANEVSTPTPIYVSFYSHNEEGGYWESLVDSEETYLEYRADLVQRVSLLHEHGASLNWQSDHAVLRAMANHEQTADLELTGGKPLLQWMTEEMGVVVDPHGHLTAYNMADLAYLIEQLGVEPSGVVGGFQLITCGETSDEVAYVDWESVIELEDGVIHGRVFPDALWTPTVLAQPAMIGHTLDEFSSGVWRPGAEEDFIVHQPSGDLITVGQGYPHDQLNIGETNSGGATILYEGAGYIQELATKIASGEVDAGGFYTASIHLRDEPSLLGVDSTLEGLRQTLDALAPLVESGQVVYLDYESVAALWESKGSEPTRLTIDAFSVADEVMAGFEQSCAEPQGCLETGCPDGEVCMPNLDRCVADCRLSGCPEQVPYCDETTGICVDTEPEPGSVETVVLDLTNPLSGVEWWVRAYVPSDASAQKPYPALVLVPGGSGAGSAMTNVNDPERNPISLAERGFVTVSFDADGRGNTSGEEDYCGHIHQAGLAAVIEATAQLPPVDADRIGVSTSSYGITMGSGVLARFPELPVKFLIDYEGPANRNDTGHCDEHDTGHITHDCTDDVWWSEREAATFIQSVKVPYLRIQKTHDHAQPDNDHAILMINNATAVEHGGQGVSPWTRVNSAEMNQANQTYSSASPPVYAEDSPDIVALWSELFAL